MALRGSDPGSYITEHAFVIEDNTRLVADAVRVRGHVPSRELRTRKCAPIHHGVG